jgi:hypothetical protein
LKSLAVPKLKLLIFELEQRRVETKMTKKRIYEVVVCK